MRAFSLLVLSSLAFASSVSAQLGPPPVPPENPVTESKRILGKLLFWDEQLSADNTTACATCHVPEKGGVDSINTPHPGPNGSFGDSDDTLGSLGVVHYDANNAYDPDPFFGFGLQVTRRHSQSVHTAPYSPEQFWDGRAGEEFRDPLTDAVVIPTGGGLETQALEPFLSPVEMGHEDRTWQEITDKLAVVRPMAVATNLPPDMAQALAGDERYPDLFQAAFGTPEITPVRIAFAVATFQRTLIPDQTPWDVFESGQQPNALTANQQLGLQAFMSPELKCSQCHTPPLFSDNSFRNIGLRPSAEDPGRFDVTGDPADLGKFKVPSLRNVGLRDNFFHNGNPATTTLLEAVKLYDGGGGDFPENLDPLLTGLVVSDVVAGQIADFLANGLLDQRAEQKLFPFDRPTLAFDSIPPPVPTLEGQGIGGAGGVPVVIRNIPPNVGNVDYKLGVQQALGGTPALIVLSAIDPVFAGPSNFIPVGPIFLSGSGASGGYGTLKLPIPDKPSLVGRDIWARWWVYDPSAPISFARSRWAKLTLF